MCGICGIIDATPGQAKAAVHRMMHAMVHRGPDDGGYVDFVTGSDSGATVAFGFRRLAILDLSQAGHQPMVHPATGDCLVFNGEIYNYRSLRSQLQAAGAVFRGTSDTEVLLHALAAWGEAAVGRLEGMFAFAWYRTRDRRLLLARDPLGIKPLYVAESPHRVVFASEVRAVLASGLVSRDLDPAGIAGLLAYGAPQDPLTVHRAVRSFPAGQTQWYDLAEGVRLQPGRRFWRFPATSAPPVPRDTAARHLKRLVKEAVARHLVSDRPVGVFLSAGIDSFLIAALAKQLRGEIKTFTVGFDETGLIDEVAEAAAAAQTLGTDHHAIVIGADSVKGLWERWLATSDRPSIDGFNTFVVSQAVGAAGKTVALSGLGGDEIFGGYPNFASARRYRRILAALHPLPRFAKKAFLLIATQGRRPIFRERAAELLDGGPDLRRITLRLRRILTDRQINRLGIEPGSVGLDDDYLAPGALASTATDQDADAFNVVSHLESVLYMGNTLLRDTDAVSMANSLEVRVPLLDQPVVDFVSALPGNVKMPSGRPTKFLLREACRDLIPDSLANRPKTGFCLPIARWMHGPVRESCEASIDAAARSGVLDAREVQSIWRDFLASSSNVHWIRPMTLVALGAYLRNGATTSDAVANGAEETFSRPLIDSATRL